MGNGTPSDSGEGHRPSCEHRSARNVSGYCIQRAEIAGCKYLCAPLRRPNFLTSALRFLVVFGSMDLTKERRNGGGRGKRKGLVRPSSTWARPRMRRTILAP